MSGAGAPPYSIQAATVEYAMQITKLVRGSRLNPSGLDWQRFLIALDQNGELIGCGQVKPHKDGSLELASIVVRTDWRRQGVGTRIIRGLLAANAGRLYLFCQVSLGSMYKSFGFKEIGEGEMPSYFRRVSRLAGILAAVREQGESLLVMEREGQ
jgi:N-acetylglutamate synthase-like GNAT family acetyltransferase